MHFVSIFCLVSCEPAGIKRVCCHAPPPCRKPSQSGRKLWPPRWMGVGQGRGMDTSREKKGEKNLYCLKKMPPFPGVNTGGGWKGGGSYYVHRESRPQAWQKYLPPNCAPMPMVRVMARTSCSIPHRGTGGGTSSTHEVAGSMTKIRWKFRKRKLKKI